MNPDDTQRGERVNRHGIDYAIQYPECVEQDGVKRLAEDLRDARRERDEARAQLLDGPRPDIVATLTMQRDSLRAELQDCARVLEPLHGEKPETLGKPLWEVAMMEIRSLRAQLVEKEAEEA